MRKHQMHFSEWIPSAWHRSPLNQSLLDRSPADLQTSRPDLFWRWMGTSGFWSGFWAIAVVASACPAWAGETTTPATLSTGNATDLTIEEVSVESTGRDQPALSLPSEITDATSQSTTSRSQSLSDFLNLPDGLVVRGTRGAGLAIGTEF